MEQIDVIEQSLGQLAGVLDNVTADHRDLPTPCAEFTMHDLVEHVTGSGVFLGQALNVEIEPNGDSAASYVRSVADPLVSHIRENGLPETVKLGDNELPGQAVATILALEGLVHGWDAARATDQDYNPPEELVTAVDQQARQLIPENPRDPQQFGPVQSADGGSAMDQLAAYTGRTLD